VIKNDQKQLKINEIDQKLSKIMKNDRKNHQKRSKVIKNDQKIIKNDHKR